MGATLNTQWKFQFRWLRPILSNTVVGISLLFALVLSACNNLGSLSRNPSSLIDLSDPYSGSGGSFQLNGVYASQQSPGTQYDMVGADSQFDTYCAGPSGPCVCEFTYVSPGAGTITDQGTVTYQESNLLRCNNAVPSGLTAFDVRILATTTGDYSNAITVNLSSGGFVNTNYIDLSKESAYLQAKRFQCRKREFIRNPLSVDMVDPVQAEDPKVIYPFNFYTTNVAGSAWEMQQHTSQEWDCSLTPTHDRSLHWWSNPYVYSASTCTDLFCASDGEWMTPDDSLVSGKLPVNNLSANGKARSAFHLAKNAYGVFQVPVKAAVAPNDYLSSKYGIIGYAARPIPTSGGSSSCPNITIPSNAHWAKLWNFRATDITPPRYVTGSTSMTASGIACNTISGVFPSCDLPGYATMAGASTDWRSVTLSSVGTSPNSIFFANPTAALPAASQVASATAMNTIASRAVVLTNGNLNACYNIAAMGNGTEVWDPSPYAFTSVGLGIVQNLPWDILTQVNAMDDCGTAGNWVNHAGGGFCAGFHLLENEATDSTVTTSTLSANNYTDQMFVVSDVAVNDAAMLNQALSVSQYKPVTYRTSNDCNTASRAGCPTGKEVHWDINIKDVGSPTGPDQYPLCVLQFTD